MRHRHLHDHAPGLRTSTCPVSLGDFPTPVTEASGLARELGLVSLHVKRDDLSSPVYGGTKVRALEYLLGDALASGASGVVTLGPEGSHHVLATALFAQRIGLRVRAVTFPQPRSEDAGRVARALAGLGIEVRRVRSPAGIPWAMWRAGRTPIGAARPYPVPAGGTSVLGILGAAEGALEVVHEVREGRVPAPEVVLVPAGSCGTAAGLVLGFGVGGLPVTVAAVRVAPRLLANPVRVGRLVRGAMRLLRRSGLRAGVRPAALAWVSSQAGEGYAIPTPEAAAAAAGFERQTGMLAETTYTGKALAHLAAGAFRGRRVLFWNTLSAVPPPG